MRALTTLRQVARPSGVIRDLCRAKAPPAGNGHAGLRAIPSEPIDLLIVDLLAPEMDGGAGDGRALGLLALRKRTGRSRP
jgi:CheY-like chemotaxis protein